MNTTANKEMHPTKDEFNDALKRVIVGTTTVADADIILKYVARLERELQSYQRWEASVNDAISECGKYIP